MAKANDDLLDSLIRFNFCIKSYKILRKKESSIEKNAKLLKISNSLHHINNVNNFKEVNRFLINECIKTKDSSNLAKSYNTLAYNFIYSEENDSAFYYLNKSEKILLHTKDSLTLGKNYLGKAYIHYTVSDYNNCIQSSSLTLNYLKNLNEDKSKYNAFNYIGVCSNELKDFETSLIYHNKALDIVEKGDIDNSGLLTIKTQNNIGCVYQNMKKYDEAITYFKKALKSKQLQNENNDFYAILIDNYAYSKLKLDDFNELPGLFYVSLKIREKNQLNQGIILSKIHLSEYYNEVKDTFQSKKFAYEALKLARSTKVSGDILASLKHISTVDKKNLTQFYKEYIKLSDSVQNEERKVKDRFARIAYETDEIIQKNTELEVINRSLVFFLIGIGGIFSLLYVVITQKMKNRELAFKQEQQATNQEIYNMMILHQEKVDATSNYEKNRMAQELHDGVLSKMFGTRMNLDSLNEANDEETIAVRHKYIQELKSIEQEIREISHDLSSVKGKIINNFVLIVIELLEEQKKSFTSDLVYSIEKTMSWEKLDNTAKINFYRILQESLQNSNKYANAKTITVSFFQTEENITMKVEDDGIGFDVAKKKKGIGLKNMISRTEESNGIYELISKQGKGTITTVSIPYNKESPTQTL
ncbi:tetratricopeptide repeat protein [Flavobacterium sp.]|jgi:signal transduction histidine kinase|uniref:tetratricopeptide repeat protein n=1 Tax=Flavobacterium sp. TaxID=239 RepID=UPI0037BF6939